MHAEVVDNERGKCPICKTTLVPVKLDLVWSCPIHVDVTELVPGTCRLCRRELVRVVKALSFTCRLHSKVNALEPGPCPTCRRPLVAKYSLRPHGNHNPKHGGQFFMAPNNWHVEVTHPAISLFRLYVYDDYSRTFIPPGFSGRDCLGAGCERQERGRIASLHAHRRPSRSARDGTGSARDHRGEGALSG